MVEALRLRRFNSMVEVLHPWTNERPGDWVAKTKKILFSARQFSTISEQKLLNLRPMSFLNRHRHRHKHRRTLQLRDWIGPVGRFSENTAQYTVHHNAQYRIMHSWAKYTIEHNAQYSTMHNAAQYTVQHNAQYNTIPNTSQCTIQQNIQYSTMYIAAQCTVQHNAQYSTMHSTA